MTQIEKNKPDEISQNDLLIQIILSNIPALTRGDVYLTEHLIGSDIWKTWSKGIRIGLGSLVYELVKNRLLPLSYVGKTKSNKCLYRLE